MDNLPQQPQYLLDLSDKQRNIIQAHAMSAISTLSQLKFSQEKQLDAMLAHAYEQGKLAMCSTLQSYDQDQLDAIKQEFQE